MKYTYVEMKFKEFSKTNNIYRSMGAPFLMPMIKKFSVKNKEQLVKAMGYQKMIPQFDRGIDTIGGIHSAALVQYFVKTKEQLIYSILNEIIDNFVQVGQKAEQVVIDHLESQGGTEITPRIARNISVTVMEQQGIDGFLVKDELKMAITVKSKSFDNKNGAKPKKQSLISRMVKHNIAYLYVVDMNAKRVKIYTAAEFATKGNLKLT